jgi:RNA-directed DNA polymerase
VVKESWFTTLVHHINEQSLMAAHAKMKKHKAVGVDGESWATYDQNLEENVKSLVAKMKRQAYKPQPVRRVYIPKPGEKQHSSQYIGIL